MTKIQNPKPKNRISFEGQNSRLRTTNPALPAGRYNLRSRKGFTLIFAVLVSTLLLALGLGIFNIIIKELTISSTIRDSQIAFSAADAGAECALFWDRKYDTAGLDNGAFGGIDLSGLTDGLVAHWKLDDGSGTTASDSSTNSNDGTLVNMSTDSWSSGEIGGGLNFDGVDDYVRISDDSSLFVGNTITISAWFWRDTVDTSIDNRDTIYSDLVGSQVPDAEYSLELMADTSRAIFYSNDNGVDGNVNIIGSIGPYNLEEWNHVVLTWDGSTVTFYMNGSFADSGLFSYTPAEKSNTQHMIGRRTGGFGEFDGILDDVRVYNRALTSEEVDALYKQKAIQRFTAQEEAGTDGVTCNEVNITKSSPWIVEEETNISNDGDISNDIATTEFNLEYADGTCSNVTVIKQGTTTKIDSRGYNTCDTSFPRRVERGLRVTY